MSIKLACCFFLLNSIILPGCSSGISSEDENDPLTPREVISLIQRGINIGNTLEPPDEGSWNNGPVNEYYFDDYKEAGFQCVRIPVRWGTHTLQVSPYTINSSWISRVEQVIDWGLERDLYIIINGHHEDWLKTSYTTQNIEKYESIWRQISERFQNKSPKLLFEIINEPNGLSVEEVDDINSRILGIIRQSNETRIVIYSGYKYSNLNEMLEASVPGDEYIMAYFHSYDPWFFAGEGQGTWGTASDRAATALMFSRAARFSADYGIPVMISEFGAVRDCDYNSRMLHYYTYVEEALKNNIAFQVWDDGGDFGIYERDSRTWPEIKEILINTFPEGPASLQVLKEDNHLRVSWTNRTSSYSSIRVERRGDGEEFSTIAVLDPAVSEYVDTELEPNTSYTYRIIAEFEEAPDMYSYPYKILFQ